MIEVENKSQWMGLARVRRWLMIGSPIPSNWRVLCSGYDPTILNERRAITS